MQKLEDMTLTEREDIFGLESVPFVEEISDFFKKYNLSQYVDVLDHNSFTSNDISFFLNRSYALRTISDKIFDTRLDNMRSDLYAYKYPVNWFFQEENPEYLFRRHSNKDSNKYLDLTNISSVFVFTGVLHPYEKVKPILLII